VRLLPETVILRGGGLGQQKLTQHMFVVGDYLSEQASVGLSQKVVKRRHVSRAEAALFSLLLIFLLLLFVYDLRNKTK